MMSNRARFSALALVAVLAAIRAHGAQADESLCRQVSGSISASIVGNPGVTTGLALGTVTGDLKGSTMATFAASNGTEGRLQLQLNHNFVTDTRGTLDTTDMGVLIPVPGADGIYRMSVNYTVTGGTGEFSGASGTLRNHGEADLPHGLLTLTYTGRLCTPRPGSNN